RLKHHQAGLAGKALGEGLDLVRGIGDAPMAGARVEEIEVMLGDIDSDAQRGYAHGAWSCDARSGGAASCNCSGDRESGRGSGRATVSGTRNPTISRPHHHRTAATH